MTDPEFQRFHNALRILLNIDMSDLVNNGVIADEDTASWQSFRADPFRWLIRADDESAAKLWNIIQRRQPKETP